MEAAAYSYAKRYPSSPPRELLPAVKGQLRRLNTALDRPQSLCVRQQAIVLVGMISGLAGNLWLDLGQQDRASGFFDVGELAAKETEDSDLAAWVLATRSIGPFFVGQSGWASGPDRGLCGILSPAWRS